MARQFAPVFVDIWSNPDFTALSHHAQHLYLLALSHPTTSTAGVLDYRPNRLAALSPTLTRDTVETAAQELEEAGFLVIDRDTEEAAIRSWFRNTLVLKQPNMAVNAFKSLLAVASPAIHATISREVRRLDAEQPPLAGLQVEEARRYSDTHPGDDDETEGEPGPRNPSRKGSTEGSEKGSTNPSRKGSDRGLSKGSGKGSREGSDGGSPIISNLKIDNQGVTVSSDSYGARAREAVEPPFDSSGVGGGLGASAPAADLWAGHPGVVGDSSEARCREHAGLPRVEVPACGACGAARRLAEDRLKSARQGAAERRKREIGACPLCGPDGFVKRPSGAFARCGHGQRPDSDGETHIQAAS